MDAIGELIKQVLILATLTLGITQVYKEVISDKNTQRVSVWIAGILALVTGTSLLLPLGFTPAINFVDVVPQFGIVFKILFYFADIGAIAFLASRGANFIVDLLSGDVTLTKKVA